MNEYLKLDEPQDAGEEFIKCSKIFYIKIQKLL